MLASNFLNAIWRALTQPKQISDYQIERRLSTCENCPHFDPRYRQCGVCQCFVDFKASLGSESCPERRW